MRNFFTRKCLFLSIIFLLISGCIIVPVKRDTNAPFDREKKLDYSKKIVFKTLEQVLLKNGFTIKEINAVQGTLTAEKTGVQDADAGYFRFQKFCVLWGYGSYGTVILDACTEEAGAKKTVLKLRITPKMTTGKILDKTMEDLEAGLFMGNK